MTAVKSQYCSGKDISGVSKWYSIPLYTAKIETVDIKWTIRNQNCKKIVYDGSTKCSNCANLIKNESFRKRAIQLNERKLKTTDGKLSNNNNKNLTHSERNIKLQSYRKIVTMQRKKLYNLSLQLARSKSARSKLHDKISSLAQRGDVSAICHNLHQAFESGCLSN